MQAVEQVFTETAGLRVNDQVSIRGRDDPHIDLLFSSACKNAFLVPEQSRLDQVLGQSAAINRDKRLRAPRAAAMDRARDQLFPDTGFAFNQNRSDADAAAFAAALRTGSIAGERLITSAMVSVPLCLRLSRCNSPR